MSHTTDIESRSNPDGLQEIRSWASRTPATARPGFRTQNGPGTLRLPLQIAGSLGLAMLLLVTLAGSRSSESRESPSAPTAVPAPEQVVSAPEPEPEPVDGAPPAAEVAAEEPRIAQEPRKEAAVAVPRKPAVKEPEASPAIVVSRDVFESEPAVLLSEPSADYPEVARGTGTSARVIVGFTIDETGAVRNPIIESTRIEGDAPKAPFEEAALTAARRARFAPARERGVPARSWSTLTFLFETGDSNAGI